MDAFERWRQDGFFIGRLSYEEMRGYGLWTIGTNVPREHPGYHEHLFVKSPWFARPEKYAKGKYPFKDRKEEDRWEYVMVLGGRLDVLVRRGEEVERTPLEAGECADIPPHLQRRWEFPEGCTFAMGTSAFRKLKEPPIRPGAGEGYEFRLWSSDTPERLIAPLSLGSWHTQYVDVLEGALMCHTPDGVCSLTPASHVFARPGIVIWDPVGDARTVSRGVVVYLGGGPP